MNDYQPQPIDTTGIKLPNALEKLTETLAASTHDHWALARIEEGWRYGPARNDEKKTHPDLVPYEQLCESEKEYDRRTATETIKAIIALGYRIEPVNDN